MRAILLAAGFGTRLRPLTNKLPKCLVPIKGRPLLDIWLSDLSLAGLGPFLVNTHYLSEQVENYLKACAYVKNVHLVNEKKLLGTAGTLIENLHFFQGQDGLLIHADNYCRADFQAFIHAHENRPSTCLITMMTFKTDSPSSCGIVELDERGVVVGFHEKVASPPGNLANGAIYILSSDFLHLLDTEFSGVSDFSTEVLPNMTGRIYTYEEKAGVIDIGTPDAYARANADVV